MRANRLFLAAMLLLAPAIAAAAPAPDLWVAYEPQFSSSLRGPGSGNLVGDGTSPIFAVRLRGAGRGGAADADLLTPAAFDRVALTAADVRLPLANPQDSAADRVIAEYLLLIRAVEHHRPAATLRIDRAGRARIAESAELRRYASCAGPAIERAIARGEAVAGGVGSAWWSAGRRGMAEALGPDPAPPALLIGAALLSPRTAPAPPPSDMETGRPAPADAPPIWLPQPREPPPAAAPRRARTQWMWRADRIAAAGRTFAVQLDLLREGNSQAARLCRSLAFTDVSGVRSDHCSIQGVVDVRDGWPIFVTLYRTGESPDRRIETQRAAFYRLAPLEGFVPPPHPCG